VIRPSARSRRGFTLIELLIGVVVSLIAIAGAVTMLAAQKRSFQTSSADRALQETGRMALGAISQDLRVAGFGVEPAMVFDFGLMNGVPMERAPQGPGKTVSYGGASASGNGSAETGFTCGSTVTCRDSIAGPDELAFQYRDPSFNHLVTSVVSATEIRIAGPLHQPIRAGQVLQAVCYSGSMVWAYVRVASEVPATQDPGPIRIVLQPGVALEYPHQNSALAPGTGDSCFTNGTVTGGARVFKMQRLRYFVQSYDAAGRIVAWNTPGSRPYLMLDRGLSSADLVPVVEVVSPDVEDLQVSYVFPLAAVEAQVAGSTVGTRVDNSETGIDFAPPGGIFPTYAAARLSAVRATHYPSNIRAVRVAVVIRSPNADPNQIAAPIPAAGNRPPVAAGDPGFPRILFETSVALPNMESRAPFFPSIVPTTDALADVLNVGGG
jgi:type IV pilus assembly protein PilW